MSRILIPAVIVDRLDELAREGYTGATELHWNDGQILALKVPRAPEVVRVIAEPSREGAHSA